MARTRSILIAKALREALSCLAARVVVKTRRVKRVNRSGVVFGSFLIESWNEVVLP
jgi:hypothetical protein